MKTKTELLKQARTEVPEVTPAELSRQTPRPVVLDVREKQETDLGMLPGAKHVPRGYLELRIEEAVPDHNADVVLYCAGGTRSLLAGRTLRDMGYTRVRSLAGGYGAWKDAGLPRSQRGRGALLRGRNAIAPRRPHPARHGLHPRAQPGGRIRRVEGRGSSRRDAGPPH